MPTSPSSLTIPRFRWKYFRCTRLKRHGSVSVGGKGKVFSVPTGAAWFVSKSRQRCLADVIVIPQLSGPEVSKIGAIREQQFALAGTHAELPRLQQLDGKPHYKVQEWLRIVLSNNYRQAVERRLNPGKHKVCRLELYLCFKLTMETNLSSTSRRNSESYNQFVKFVFIRCCQDWY